MNRPVILLAVTLLLSACQTTPSHTNATGSTGAGHTPIVSSAPPPPGPLAAKVGQEIGGIGMTCSSPYELSRDCSIWSGATRSITRIGGKHMIAANDDGDIILVMLDTHAFDSGRQSVWHKDLGLKRFDKYLTEQNITIRKVRPVKVLSKTIGYVLELDADGYSVLTR